MLVIELRDKIIEAGIASVKKNETRPERVRGGLAGFEICKTLNSPEDFQRVLAERSEVEHGMKHARTPAEEYWEYRIATLQVEFLWERMRVAWGIGESFSARAMLQVNEIMEAAG